MSKVFLPDDIAFLNDPLSKHLPRYVGIGVKAANANHNPRFHHLRHSALCPVSAIVVEDVKRLFSTGHASSSVSNEEHGDSDSRRLVAQDRKIRQQAI